MKISVCDKVECPLHGYFMDSYSHPEIKVKLDKARAEAKDSDGNRAVANLIDALDASQFIKTTCLACTHFTKQDMMAELLKNEAVNFLTK